MGATMAAGGRAWRSADQLASSSSKAQPDAAAKNAEPGGLQALAQFVPARRQDEDQHRVREQLLDLQRALPVDLQHHVLAAHEARPAALRVAASDGLGPTPFTNPGS